MTLRLRLARVGFRWRVAAAAACLLLAVLSALNDGAAPSREDAARTIVVAARALPAGHRVTARDLALARSRTSWPGVPPDTAQVVGRTLAGPVARGEPISRLRLVDRSLTTGLDRDLVALPVDIATDVRGLVRAGSRVDLFSVPVESGDARGDDGRLAAARALVLAVLPPSDSTPGCRLVLAVERGRAPRIAGAGSSGMFRVAALPP